MTTKSGTESDGGRDPDSDRASDLPDRDSTVDLLRRALGGAPVPERSLLPKVQERIAVVTRGRYFRRRPKYDAVPLLLGAALLVLVVAVVVYVVLVPLLG